MIYLIKRTLLIEENIFNNTVLIQTKQQNKTKHVHIHYKPISLQSGMKIHYFKVC